METKRWFGIALAAVLLGTPLSSMAVDMVRIGGGPPTGQYLPFARSTCDYLGNLFPCNATETKGSGANLDGLRKDVGDPTSYDVIYIKGSMAEDLLREPDAAGKYEFVRSVAGEAAFTVMNRKTAAAVRNWQGVKDAAFLLSIGLPGEESGDAAVFRALQKVDGSPLKDLDVRVYKGREELLTAVKSGQVRVGWYVQYPNTKNPLFRMINDSEDLVVMGVVDQDMNQLGGSVGVNTVTIADAKAFGLAGAAKKIETTTLRAAIVAKSPSVYPEGRARKIQQAVIAKLKAAKDSDILPKEEWLTAYVNDLSAAASANVAEMVTKLKGDAVGASDRVKGL